MTNRASHSSAIVASASAIVLAAAFSRGCGGDEPVSNPTSGGSDGDDANNAKDANEPNVANDADVADVVADVPSGADAGFDAADAADAPVVDALDAADATGTSDGGLVALPSCVPGGAGRTNCGSGGGSESCCTSLSVTGGSYYRTYTNDGDGGRSTADPATVSSFRLDKYEVTVGRFRQFVTAWSNGSGWLPPAGAGKHTHLNGGQGLANGSNPGTYESGWNTGDNGNVSPTRNNLWCTSGYQTWTETPDSNENLPINCVNWYEAYAFCIWDGGFLPSEAEWGYAAAGGSQLREYPWGSTPLGTACPGTGCQYAIYGCNYPSGSGSCTGVANIAPVGTPTLGAGQWGQLDLAGNVFEWNVDWYATYVNPCTDCASVTAASDRLVRGGFFEGVSTDLLPPYRRNDSPTYRGVGVGFRCARTP
jgi:formylglycine-generating enzyme required for sulfatase activity